MNFRGTFPHSIYRPSFGADFATLNTFLRYISSIRFNFIIWDWDKLYHTSELNANLLIRMESKELKISQNNNDPGLLGLA